MIEDKDCQNTEEETVTCSFCGRVYDGTNMMMIIQANQVGGVYICSDCIEKCHGIVVDAYAKQAKEKDSINVETMTPADIKAYLDKYIIGQERAKKTLAVAVHNHIKMLKYYDYMADHPNADNVECEKANVLMCGSSGSGFCKM